VIVIGSFFDDQQWTSRLGLQDASFLVPGIHSPNHFFRPMQSAPVAMLEDVIQGLLLEILPVDTREDTRGQVAGDQRDRFAVYEPQARNLVDPLTWRELECLCDFEPGLFDLEAQEARRRNKSSPLHLFAEPAKLLKIPGHAPRAYDRKFPFGDDEQSFGPQFLERLSHRHFADRESPRKITFRAENFARLEMVLLDEIPNLIDDLLVVGNETLAVESQMQRGGVHGLECADPHISYNVAMTIETCFYMFQ